MPALVGLHHCLKPVFFPPRSVFKIIFLEVIRPALVDLVSGQEFLCLLAVHEIIFLEVIRPALVDLVSGQEFLCLLAVHELYDSGVDDGFHIRFLLY